MSKAEEFIQDYTRTCSNEQPSMAVMTIPTTNGSLPTKQKGLWRLQGKN